MFSLTHLNEVATPRKTSVLGSESLVETRKEPAYLHESSIYLHSVSIVREYLLRRLVHELPSEGVWCIKIDEEVYLLSKLKRGICLDRESHVDYKGKIDSRSIQKNPT